MEAENLQRFLENVVQLVQRERERDGRTQVRGTVQNKCLTHIYLMTVLCEILTNYYKVVTLLATL